MRLSLLLLPLLLLSGCATGTATPPADAHGSRTVTLGPGERTALPGGGQLRYLRVVSDSRCRPQVQCIHAGEARLEFEVVPDGADARTVQLSTADNPPAVVAGPVRLELVSLDHGDRPQATLRIENDS